MMQGAEKAHAAGVHGVILTSPLDATSFMSGTGP